MFEREEERGGSSLMEPSPALGLISQRLYVCVCVCIHVRMCMNEKSVSVNMRLFNIPPE